MSPVSKRSNKTMLKGSSWITTQTHHFPFFPRLKCKAFFISLNNYKSAGLKTAVMNSKHHLQSESQLFIQNAVWAWLSWQFVMASVDMGTERKSMRGVSYLKRCDVVHLGWIGHQYVNFILCWSSLWWVAVHLAKPATCNRSNTRAFKSNGAFRTTAGPTINQRHRTGTIKAPLLGKALACFRRQEATSLRAGDGEKTIHPQLKRIAYQLLPGTKHFP